MVKGLTEDWREEGILGRWEEEEGKGVEKKQDEKERNHTKKKKE